MKILLHYVEDYQSDQREQFAVIYNKNMTEQEDLYVLLNHPELLIVCDNCQRKLNQSAHVMLIISPSERRDLCFTCLLKLRREYPKQSYYVRSNLNLTLTQKGWCILSELILLKCLQKFNYGNWKKIKDYMDFYGFNFTVKQIENHYKSIYLSTDSQPIFYQYPIQLEHKNSFTPSVCKQDSLPKDEIKHPLQVYNPQREQYILDFNPQAEDIIADLEFLNDDTNEEIEMKYKLLETYNQQIKERKKREQIVTEHKLLTDEYKKKLLCEGKVKNEISRFMTYQQSENLLNSLTLQYTLSGTLYELGRQRRKLIAPTFDKIYENMKKIKENRSIKRSRNIYKEDEIECNKRKLSMITVEEMRKRLKQSQKFKDLLKITCLNSSLK